MKSWKDNISFVLVEPKEPGNIGSAARAMKNMGFKSLELIRPVQFPGDEARQMACNASAVLENAAIHRYLRDALKDKSLVVGTTRRTGRQRGLILPVKESVKRIVAAAKRNQIAILFGRERNGLTNMEVSQCGFLVTIPSDPASPSMNLSQSVLLIAYELAQKTYRVESPPLVSHEELENLCRHMRSALRLLEYSPRGDRNLEKKIMSNLRRLIGRSGLTEWESQMLHGICEQIRRRVK